MKSLNICFIASVLVTSLLGIDFTEAQVKRYATLDDFLLDLETTAVAQLDYVTMMQALMCPNQPICGADGELDRTAVLDALPPALTIGNLTVNLEDISNAVGLCCLHCSCSDSCREDGNCCPIKQVLMINDSNPTVAMRQECTVASSRSNVVERYQMDHTYLMVTKCLFDNDNQTLIANCEHPEPGNINDNLPVTSLGTGDVYRNMACAVCNDDAGYVMEWERNIVIKLLIPYFSNTSVSASISPLPFPDTYEMLLKFVRSPRMAVVIYSPPEGLSIDDKKCIPKDAFHPKTCEIPPNTDALWTRDLLYESCRNIVNPVRFLDGTIYSNVFCFECHRQGYFRPTNHHCDYGENLRAPENCLIGLLDYKSARDTTKSHGDDRLPADSPCTCAEIFDPFQNYCRPLICPAGEVYIGCRCVSLLTKLTGLSVILKVKVTAKSDRVEQLTGAQLRKLNTALKTGLETTAIHTTVEIDSTFRQENTSRLTYLCVVEAQSHPGHDTKTTMKPFLQYLDTDEALDINIGKLDFSASLTTKAMLWTELDSEQNVFFFKTCCLDQDSNTLHRV